MARKLMILINTPDLFLTHRQHLAEGAKGRGYDVVVVCPQGSRVDEIRSLGYECETLKLGRKSISPVSELVSLWQLRKIMKKHRPDVLHCFTMKPILYGTLVGWLSGAPQILNTVTGLGFAFIDKSIKARLIRGVLGSAFRFYRKLPSVSFVFQNRDDRDLFVLKGWVEPRKSCLIPGTGVDTAKFHLVAPQNDVPRLLFVGRFLKDKGMSELIDACDFLYHEGLSFKLVLVGRIDPGNPNSLDVDDLDEIVARPYVEHLGYQTDLAKIYMESDVVCLPSYREGIPLTLLEGAACGRPIVATDVPGCREVVEDGENGYLVPARESSGLRIALEKLVKSPELRLRMGANSRKMAEMRFDKKIVVEQCLALYSQRAG